MIIEDRTAKKVLFITLEVGDTFRFINNLYVKIDPIYPIDPNSDIEDIEDFMKESFPMTAYDLISHDFVSISGDAQVQPVKATLIIE